MPRGGLAGHWRGKIVYKLERVFVSLSILLYSFLRSNTMRTAFKVKKKNTWSIAEEKDFLLLRKEKAITDLLDKCVTSAGVSRPFFFKLSQFIFTNQIAFFVL